MNSNINNILKQNGLSITPIRQEIISIFLNSKRPVSIFDFKSSQKINKKNESTIYRNLIKLEQKGIIQQVPSSHNHQLYELTTPKTHHHHIVCYICKKIKCLKDCSIERALSQMAKKQGFNLTGHSLELFGTCQDCHLQ